MRKNACCFTGHREIPPEDREPLRAALLSEIQRLYAEKGVAAQEDLTPWRRKPS